MNRWQNQQEAYEFAMSHDACMLDMDMGTGKTRVAIDVAMTREDVNKILVVCPKSVIPVWRVNLEKFYPNGGWNCMDMQSKISVKKKTQVIRNCMELECSKLFVVVNYDIVWRNELGDFIHKTANFDMIILDESHRAKAAGSKVSKFLGMVGKHTKYKLCLSGTPMANSPLDVYGQYRFLDNRIFGTNYNLFEQTYAIKGGPDLRFVVGFKNQQDLRKKFESIAYTCKMSDIKDQLKMPEELPPVQRLVTLPTRDMSTIRELSREFIAECGSGHVVVQNALVKILRMQQITSGFCQIQENPMTDPVEEELNTAKQDELLEILSDVSPLASLVVFCVFRHDIKIVRETAEKAKRKAFEVSGSENTLEEWKKEDGAVLVVQIQSGAEGIDMTKSNYAIYYSLPHSLALYNQSKARLYRPGQKSPVSFIHLIAENTIDEAMYNSLRAKRDIIESIKTGSFDFGYVK